MKKKTGENIILSDERIFSVKCVDGAAGIMSLPDKSIKLIYGSPPYPNASRNYGSWDTEHYISLMAPFINAAKIKLRDDGFIVINVKANRNKSQKGFNSQRSLIVEKLAIEIVERWKFYCVDIEIWIKENPVPTGLRVACQDAYEQNLWFSINPKWKINLDAIGREYDTNSLKIYANNEYKPRKNGLTYVRHAKKIDPNPKGALPINIIKGAVSSKQSDHQAVQPPYLADKYIKATTSKGDIVVDPWMGSGTTGYVALSLGRKFIGFDIKETFVAYAFNSFTKLMENLTMKAKVSKQREDIHEIFINALGSYVKSHSNVGERPLIIDLLEPLPITIVVYLFQATNPPGGRTFHEYKINLNVPDQIRGKKGNFDESKGIVILASYISDLDIFVLYDAYKHKQFAYNANVQCKDKLIYEACQKNIAKSVKNNGELLIACRSKYLVNALKERFKYIG